MTQKLYECNNKDCELGTPGHTAHFIGGVTAEAVTLRTGAPIEDLEEGKDYGEGICPNCGKKGKKTNVDFEPLVGKDPWDAKHKEADKKARKKIEAITTDYQNGDITEEEFRAELEEISAEAQEAVLP